MRGHTIKGILPNPIDFKKKIEHDYPQYFGPDAVERPLALEIFARNYRAGWDGFGYEYPGRPAKNQAIATKSGSDVELIDSSDEKSTLDQSGSDFDTRKNSLETGIACRVANYGRART